MERERTTARSFPALLYDGFRRVQGFLIGVIGVVLTIAAWQIPSARAVPVAWVVPVGVVALLLIFTLWDAAYRAFSAAVHPLPRVRGRVKATPIFGSAIAILLLEPSALFSHDTIVSVYYIDEDGFERLTGIGRVLNIQGDGKIQVGITYLEPSLAETFEEATKSPARLQRIIVKPNVPEPLLKSLVSEVWSDES